MDESALIRNAQHGDLDAFNTLVLAFQDIVYNTALRILGDEDLAADASQEAFISAFRALNSYRGGSFRAWLLRTVTNACYDEPLLRSNPTPKMEPNSRPRAGWPIPVPPLKTNWTRRNLNMLSSIVWKIFPPTSGLW
jgi:RNA polymerase sigma-70 factor (ECF subfamily)